MNAKQTMQAAPAAAAIAAAAPQLFLIGAIGCGIYFGLKWLFSDDAKKKSETPPSSPAVPENPKIPLPVIGSFSFPADSGKIISEKSEIPQNSAGISNPPRTPSLPSAPATPVPAVPKNPFPPLHSVIPAAEIQPEIPPLARKKIISREDMAKIFNGGRGLTRKAAVSALKTLGFGKTAAYQALEINGRFAPWLQFAADGIIFWKINGK